MVPPAPVERPANVDRKVTVVLREPLAQRDQPVLKVSKDLPDRLDQMGQPATEDRQVLLGLVERQVQLERVGRRVLEGQQALGGKGVFKVQQAHEDQQVHQTGPLRHRALGVRVAYTMVCASKMAGGQARGRTLQRVTV